MKKTRSYGMQSAGKAKPARKAGKNGQSNAATKRVPKRVAGNVR